MKNASTMSKRRFYDICDALKGIIPDQSQVDQAIEAIKTIMQFDPNIKYQYTPEKAEQIKRYRAMKKEQGISTYESSGNKAAYRTRKLREAELKNI